MKLAFVKANESPITTRVCQVRYAVIFTLVLFAITGTSAVAQATIIVDKIPEYTPKTRLLIYCRELQ